MKELVTREEWNERFERIFGKEPRDLPIITAGPSCPTCGVESGDQEIAGVGPMSVWISVHVCGSCGCWFVISWSQAHGWGLPGIVRSGGNLNELQRVLNAIRAEHLDSLTRVCGPRPRG